MGWDEEGMRLHSLGWDGMKFRGVIPSYAIGNPVWKHSIFCDKIRTFSKKNLVKTNVGPYVYFYKFLSNLLFFNFRKNNEWKKLLQGIVLAWSLEA